MADQALAKQFIIGKGMISNFLGYNSASDKTKVSPNFFVQGSQNVYKKLSGNIAVRQGQKLYVPANTALSPISSEFVWTTSWGETRVLIVSNGELQVLYNNNFYNLQSTGIFTRYVFDKWVDPTESKDRALFVRGDNNIYHWSGGIAVILSTTANTITKTGTKSWVEEGFSSTAGELSITINGNTYTYTGGQTTTTLTGVSGSPTGEANGSIVLQSVLTVSNSPVTLNFKNDFIKVVGNRLWVGCYTNRTIWNSSSTDFDDFSTPSPDVVGSGNFISLDSNPNAFSLKDGNLWCSFGTSEWTQITFPQTTINTAPAASDPIYVTIETITSTPLPVAKNQAALAHEFVSTSGNNIIYLSQDQQLTVLGNFNLAFTLGFASLSLDVATELMAENFTGGALKCIGEFTYITAPNSGKVYLYQVRQSIRGNQGVAGNVQFGSNELMTERIWHAPFIWNATRIDDINGQVYSFSNANPQIYQVWDTNQWHDDSPSGQPLPYTCILAMAYKNSGDRELLLNFDKNYTEGYLTEGTLLNITINYDYLGATNQIQGIINSIMQPAYMFGVSLASLGDTNLGDKPLGDEINTEASSNPNNLIKFRCLNSIALTNCFEYQVIYWSDSTDSQWEILATGTNARVADVEPTYIINKLR